MSDYNDETNIEYSDCLALEIYSDASNKMFILYNYYDKSYFIKGLNNFQNYFNFRCKNIKDIRNFIKHIFCHSNELYLLIHNYKEFPYDCNDITFENLNDLCQTNPYAGDTLASKKFNNDKILYKCVEEQLRVIRNVYNKY